MTATIYKKGNSWTRDFTEADDQADVWYVEVPWYLASLTITVEQLLELKPKCWFRHQCGLVDKGYIDGEHIAFSGHEQEVADRYKLEVAED